MANRKGTTWRVTARVEGRPHEFFTITDDNAVTAAIRSKSALLSELRPEHANDLQEGQQLLALAAFRHILDRHYGGVPHSAVRQGDSFEPTECKTHDFGGSPGNPLLQVCVRELR